MNIINKIKDFFMKLLKIETLLIESNIENKEDIKSENIINNFKENIEMKSIDNTAVLQIRYEKGEIIERELTIKQIEDLTQNYKEQITRLDNEINNKKSILGIQ